MKIVTTPMCQEILKLAGVEKFTVIEVNELIEANRFQVNGFQLDQWGVNKKHHRADLAVVLRETDINPQIATHFLKIKLNTFSQIKESIELVSDVLGTEPVGCMMPSPGLVDINENRKIKVKVHSNFLREIVEDLGFRVTEGDDYDFLVYPDYLKHKIKGNIDCPGERLVEIPSHKNAPLNPIKRAEMRYKILEKSLCMKR